MLQNLFRPVVRVALGLVGLLAMLAFAAFGLLLALGFVAWALLRGRPARFDPNAAMRRWQARAGAPAIEVVDVDAREVPGAARADAATPLSRTPHG